MLISFEKKNEIKNKIQKFYEYKIKSMKIEIIKHQDFLSKIFWGRFINLIIYIIFIFIILNLIWDFIEK